MKIQEAVYKAHDNACEKGWWDKYDTVDSALVADLVSSKLMLVVTELAEAVEEIRDAKGFSQTYLSIDGKPEGFPIEIADAVIRICDLCGWLGINLEKAVKTKMEYNKQRPTRHGGKVI